MLPFCRNFAKQCNLALHFAPCAKLTLSPPAARSVFKTSFFLFADRQIPASPPPLWGFFLFSAFHGKYARLDVADANVSDFGCVKTQFCSTPPISKWNIPQSEQSEDITAQRAISSCNARYHHIVISPHNVRYTTMSLRAQAWESSRQAHPPSKHSRGIAVRAFVPLILRVKRACAVSDCENKCGHWQSPQNFRFYLGDCHVATVVAPRNDIVWAVAITAMPFEQVLPTQTKQTKQKNKKRDKVFKKGALFR